MKHPAGLGFEVLEDNRDTRKGWNAGDVPAEASAVGFNTSTFSVREVEEEDRFLIEGLGFRKIGQDGCYHRYEIGAGGPGAQVDLLHEPQRPSGSWIFGAGTVHHVAFNVADDSALAEQKGYYEELGYTDVSEIKDRNYFHSIYVRSPGGVLLECAATADGAFAKDEAFSELGTAPAAAALVRRPAGGDPEHAGADSGSRLASGRYRGRARHRAVASESTRLSSRRSQRCS